MVDKLLNIITKIYPEETVLKDTEVFFNTTYTDPFTKNEILGSFNSGTSSISMIETNKKYYFDVRTLLHSVKPRLPFPLNILTYSLLTILSMLIINNIFTHQGDSIVSYFMSTSIILIIFGILFILDYSLKGVNILIIKKEWIIQTSHKNKEYVIHWALPKKDRFYAFLKILGREMQVKTSLFRRMQRAFLIQKSLSMNMDSTYHSYSYKEV